MRGRDESLTPPSIWGSWPSERPELWHAGPRESEIRFSLGNPDGAGIEGWVGSWRATVVVDLEEPSRCSIAVVAEAASVQTGVAAQDRYAQSTAFLDVAQFPEIRFLSREIVAEDGGRRLTITGDLTIRGATREVCIAIECEGGKSLWEHPSGLVFKGHGSFRRLDFGLRWQGETEAGHLVAADAVDVDLRITVRPGAK